MSMNYVHQKVLYYIIEVIDNGIFTDITINELYNIIDIYNNSFDEKCKGHDKCICKNNFNKKATIEKNSNIEKMSKYLLNHLYKLNEI